MERMKLSVTLAMAMLAAAGCVNDETTTASHTSNAEGRAMGVYSSGHEDGDEAVAFEDCPEAVQQTITAHMDGGTITELERTTDHGEVLYEVDVRTAGGVVEFDVAADGAFRGYEAGDDDDDGDDMDDDDNFSAIGWDSFVRARGDEEDDDDEEIALSEVPEVVKAAALAAVPGIVLEEAEREVEDGVTVYCLEGAADGVEYEIEVSAEGKVLETEVDDEADDEGDDD